MAPKGLFADGDGELADEVAWDHLDGAPGGMSEFHMVTVSFHPA